MCSIMPMKSMWILAEIMKEPGIQVPKAIYNEKENVLNGKI